MWHRPADGSGQGRRLGAGGAGAGVRRLADDGEERLAWDPFIRHQHLIDADRPAKGVRTLTKARVGPTRFTPEERDGVAGTWATWKYTYSVRPPWLRFVAEPIGQWLLGREIRARIAAFARACEDPVVLEGVRDDR